MTPSAVQSAGNATKRAGADEVERREHGEGDAAHPVHQRLVPEEDAGHHQPDQIGRQHRFALGGRGQAAQEEQDEEDELDLRLAHARGAQARG